MNDQRPAEPVQAEPAPTSHALVASLASEGGAMTKPQIMANRRLMLDVMGEVMERGKHYGVIPGTPKPTLYKPGAELLLMMFRVEARPAIDDLSTADAIRYRVTMTGVHVPTGQSVGVGIGECSSDEEKYRWRRAVNRNEFDATPDDRRRVKFARGAAGKSDYTIDQVRTNPADVANTILKMAAKRAKIDLTLGCTAASDVFSQDLEDLEKEIREAVIEGEVEHADPKLAKAGTAAPLDTGKADDKEKNLGPGQLERLRTEMDKTGVDEKAVRLKFQIERLEDLPFDRFNEVLAWLKAIHER